MREYAFVCPAARMNMREFFIVFRFNFGYTGHINYDIISNDRII